MATINGTTKADVLQGTTGNDTVLGGKANDSITGATASGELLVDGSFETAAVGAGTWSHFAQVGGWHSDTGIEVWGKNFIENASAGDKLMELDYDNRFSKVWQDVKTTAGEEYNLSLDSAMRPGTSASTNGINVFWNGVEVAHIAPGSTTWSTEQFKLIGTGGTDRLEFREDARGNDSYGGLIDNVSLKGVAHGNLLVGGTGNDKLVAGHNGDVLVGNDVKGGAVELTKMSIHQDVTAHVAFDGSGAGYHNSVGMYTYDANGKITGVQMLFSNVSGAGVQNGPSAFDLKLHAGEHFGFFVAPNAYNQGDNAKLFDSKDGHFVMLDATNGGDANVNAGHDMQLAYVANNGSETVLHTQYWTSLFTTNTNDNADGFQHSHVTVDPLTGIMSVAFEDLMGGGDKNFHDANFTIDIGKTNAILMAHDQTSSAHAVANDDTLIGGNGNDTLLGMSGNDTITGGLGNNFIDGGTGNDHVIAGGGNDTIYGGKGFDTLDFSGASQAVNVNLASHVASGFGEDKVFGIEALIGSSFGDNLTGDKAANAIDGGDGSDHIRGGKGADVLTGGAGDDTFVWARSDVGHGVDHVTDFGNGHDVLDLSAVFKGQTGNHADKIQMIDDVAGSHLMAKIGGSYVEVAMLDNVHHTTAADLLKAGMLLV